LWHFSFYNEKVLGTSAVESHSGNSGGVPKEEGRSFNTLLAFICLFSLTPGISWGNSVHVFLLPTWFNPPLWAFLLKNTAAH